MAAVISNVVLVLALIAGCGGHGNSRSSFWSPKLALASAQPSPVNAMSRNVAVYAGCPVFTPGDWYNAPIVDAPLDANSTGRIKSVVDAKGNMAFYGADHLERVNLATSATPLVPVILDEASRPWSSQPWQPGYFIEPDGGDQHAIVLLDTPPNCVVYETYSTSFNGTTLHAHSGQYWNLGRRYVMGRSGIPSSQASGLSMFAGLAKIGEFKEFGSINHALHISLAANSLCYGVHVPPANDDGGLPYAGPAVEGTPASCMPYGAHLRLRASFSTAGWGPQSTAVADALKSYGAFVSDTGCCPAIYMDEGWDDSDIASFAKITVEDFEVLPVGAIVR
jgi:hypothetical protein